MGEKKRTEKVTLAGWCKTVTQKAVLWHDKASGNDIWFPKSRALVERRRITVPKWMYERKLREIEEDEAEAERLGAIEDAKVQADFERDMARLGYGPRSRRGCLGVLIVVAAIAVAALMRRN